MRYNMTITQHAAIFGQPQEVSVGRSRMCKVCGGWHSLEKPWPHNCRTPAKPRSSLAAPMIMPDVEPHLAGADEYIGGRVDQREFMKRNDLVEHEHFENTAGPSAMKKHMESREYEQELADVAERVLQEDPLNRPPIQTYEQANHKVAETEQFDATAVIDSTAQEKTNG